MDELPGARPPGEITGDGTGTGSDTDGGPARSSTSRSFLVELPVLLLLALGLALLVKSVAVQAFFIPSGSMEPTLAVGDRVLVDKLSYRFRDIRRGEVVVFDGIDSFTSDTSETRVDEPADPVRRALRGAAAAVGVVPGSERDFIKRVVGVPGDQVACCDREGRITVNGTPLTEAYLYPGDRPSEVPFRVEVPPGRLWVLGDHRSRSADSRSHLGDPGGGFVPVARVVGRAVAVVWPVRHTTWLRVPAGHLALGPGAAEAGDAAGPAPADGRGADSARTQR